MFCKNCGANVADNTVFCPQCGTNLAVADDEQTMALGANNAAPAPQQPAQPQSAAYTPDVPTYVSPQQAQEPQADYTPDEPTFAAVSQQPTAPQAPQAPAPQQEQPVYQAPVQPDYGYAPQQPDYGYDPQQQVYGYAPQPPKKSKKGLIIAICIAAVIVITGVVLLLTLGGDTVEDSESDVEDSKSGKEENLIVGTWEWAQNTKTIAIVLEIEADGTCAMTTTSSYGGYTDESVQTGTYTFEDDKLTLIGDDGETMTFAYADGKLTEEEVGLVFVKKGSSTKPNYSETPDFKF